MTSLIWQRKLLADAKGKLSLTGRSCSRAKMDAGQLKKLFQSAQPVPDDMRGLDIGPDTVAAYTAELAKAKTIIWNGPMGVFELAPFAAGNHRPSQRAVAENHECISIVWRRGFSGSRA